MQRHGHIREHLRRARGAHARHQDRVDRRGDAVPGRGLHLGAARIRLTGLTTSAGGIDVGIGVRGPVHPAREREEVVRRPLPVEQERDRSRPGLERLLGSDLEEVLHTGLGRHHQLLGDRVFPLIDAGDLGGRAIRRATPGDEGDVEGEVAFDRRDDPGGQGDVRPRRVGVPGGSRGRDAGRGRTIREVRCRGQVDRVIAVRQRPDDDRLVHRIVGQGSSTLRGEEEEGHGDDDDGHDGHHVHGALGDHGSSA